MNESQWNDLIKACWNLSQQAKGDLAGPATAVYHSVCRMHVAWMDGKKTTADGLRFVFVFDD